MLLLRRLSGRVASFLLGLTLIAVLTGLTLPLHAKTPKELAAERFEQAQDLLTDLNSVPELELGVAQYTLVADTFRAVHRASPASGFCDDALLAAAHIYARMVARFGDTPHLNRALEAYEYLIREYPHSKLLPEAREAIRKLKAGERVSPSGAAPVDDEQEEQQETVITEAPAPVVTRASNAPAVRPAAPPVVPPAAAPVVSVRYAPSSGSSNTVAVANKIELSPKRTSEAVAQLDDLRYWRHPDYLRIVVQLDDFVPFKYDALASPPRLYFDFFSAKIVGKLEQGATFTVDEDPVVSAIRLAQNRESKARLVLDLAEEAVFDVSWLANPPRMVLEIRPKNPPPAADRSTRMASVEPQQETFEKIFDDAAGRSAALAQPEQPASRGGFLPTARAATLTPSAPPQSQQQSLSRTATETAPVLLAKATPPPVETTPAPREVIPANLAAPKPADAPSLGSEGLIRALGLKIGRVVIDAGHGGHDTGMIGPTGLREKDVVLDIALELGRLIEQNLGAEVIYTRSDDTYLKPAARTKVANEAKGDLLISVHANASSVRSVRGIETYYLNLTTDAWAMKVASRENAAQDKSVHELRDLLGKIAQQERVAESREFATRMQAAVFSGLTKQTDGLRNRGVRQAPLIVLIGAQMPAILAEVGFLSNPTDEKLFKDKAYRRQVAGHLYDGVASYMATLSNNHLTMTDEPRAAARDDD